MCLFVTCMRPSTDKSVGHPEQALVRRHLYNFHISHNKQVFLAFLYLENSKRTSESMTSGAGSYRIDNDDQHEDD
jgi:hypothetical protein